MSLIACPDCGKKVLNLGVHLADECPKRRRVKPAPVVEVEPIDSKKARGRPKSGKVCRVCGKPVHARGLCRNHYQQEWLKSK